MRIFNINLHFYPDSIGGAAVVAEKLAWGLVQKGNDVTNIYLSRLISDKGFTVYETPFGRSIAINNVVPKPENRFSSLHASSVLLELADLLQPDQIIVHAVQHMGILDFLSNPKWTERTTIVAHDFYWVCLQGFRFLPNSQKCEVKNSAAACRGCAWFPGLIEDTYRKCRAILESCQRVIFPSQFLRSGYEFSLDGPLKNGDVVSNPDMADCIITDLSILPEPIGATEKAKDLMTFAFLGGIGETKGWSLVREFIDVAKDRANFAVFLFDLGRPSGNPWYRHPPEGAIVVDPYHWTYSAHALQNMDVILMPSRVQESFGLGAREFLSLGKKCVVRPSGALAELRGFDGVIMVEEATTVANILVEISNPTSNERREWQGTSISDYAATVLGYRP